MVVKNYGRAKMFNKMNLGYGVVQLFLWQKDAKAGPTGIESPEEHLSCCLLTDKLLQLIAEDYKLVIFGVFLVFVCCCAFR